jgi:diguanylate cyclase (GGDEF)-like protein/PAS domain S-box-containing protein
VPKNTHDPLAASRIVLQNMREGVVITDRRGCITSLNPAAERLSGHRPETALGRPATEILHLETEQGASRIDPVAECLRCGTATQPERMDFLRPAEGSHLLRVRWQTRPFDDGVVLILEDVTEQVLLTDELAYRSSHDTLTGLLNREAFEHQLQAALTEARDHGRSWLLCYLDLDQFSLINDTAGRIAGDELLRELSAVLRARLRDGDALARLDGDEFGALLPETGASGAQDVLSALHAGVKGFQFEWDNRRYSPTVSIGVARIDTHSVSVVRALREAWSACQAAKDEGRDRIHHADSEISQRFREIKLMGEFNEALEQNRFVLFAEDVVPVSDPGRVVYRELLIRMRGERGQLLMPSSFIYAAERYFLITALDRWVLQRVLEHLSTRPDDGVIHALNLSGQSLGDSKFLDFAAAEIAASGVAPHRLCMEITETAAISRLSQATRFMHRLAESGVRFSLDDFGTGMASFSYLKALPVHFLKIDGSFVHPMLESRVDRSMVDAINRIGHDMGLRTIAEQVECAEQLSALASIGVDWAQGRAIAGGRPLDEN